MKNKEHLSLTFESNTKFILTIGCICVGIYCNGNAGFKIFYSHARDLCDRGHPQRTGVLLEVSSLDSFIFYFQRIHNNKQIYLK